MVAIVCADTEVLLNHPQNTGGQVARVCEVTECASDLDYSTSNPYSMGLKSTFWVHREELLNVSVLIWVKYVSITAHQRPLCICTCTWGQYYSFVLLEILLATRTLSWNQLFTELVKWALCLLCNKSLQGVSVVIGPVRTPFQNVNLWLTFTVLAKEVLWLINILWAVSQC